MKIIIENIEINDIININLLLIRNKNIRTMGRSMEAFKITQRNIYKDRILQMLNNENLVIVTGVRSVGKSCIVMQLEEELRKKIADQAQTIRINFETIDHAKITASELIYFLKNQYIEEKINYIILDEITHVIDWENAINYFYQIKNCKLILVSSHKCIFSKKLLALQKKRNNVIDVFPLSLGEFIRFQGFKEATTSSSLYNKKFRRLGDETYNIKDIYKYYITYGGLPTLKPEHMDGERAWIIMDGSYGAIVTRDIMDVGTDKGGNVVTDTLLLRAIITIMAKSLGENIAATFIGDQVARDLGRFASTKVIESYIQALLDAHLFYISKRFDIKTNRIMQTLARYYIVDAGFHNYVADIHIGDEKQLLENKVFFELLRRGYKVYNGIFGEEEISFVAIRGEEKVFIQVTDDISEEHLEILCSPFQKMREENKKIIIALGAKKGMARRDYNVVDALEFLMGFEIN